MYHKLNNINYFLVYFFIFLFISLSFTQQEDIDVLYNAAVEKYIKNDYDKAVEYMEKIYSLKPQQKYKNFLIRILTEAATNMYMKHNYKKAYEYTSKALKYAPENQQVNELHRILTDILNNQKVTTYTQPRTEKTLPSELQKTTTTVTKPQIVQQKTKPEKMSTEYTIKTATATVQQVVYVVDKKYKILFFLTIFVLFFTITGWIITQMKLNYKIKKELQKQIFDLQKENSNLNFELTQTKIELEKTKEREQLYKKYLEDYKKDSEEKIKLITELQNKFSQVYKDKTLQYLPQKPVTEQIFNRQKTELAHFVSNPPKNIIESEYQLEIYREKIATMLKTLYEINPEKALITITQMVQDVNPFVRMNVAYALAEIANETTINLLLNLFNDDDVKVKQESLRQIIRLNNKIKNNEVVLSEELKSRITSLLNQEKLKGEWLF